MAKKKRSTRSRASFPRLDRIASFDDDDRLRVVVECPKGSAIKVTFDPKIGAFAFSRTLPAGMVFPFDFGFVPGTKAEDGDPLDALVLHDSPTHPGIVIACELEGAVLLEEDEDDGRRIRNDRLVVVPAEDDRAAAEHRGSALTRRRKLEIEKFFESSTFFEGKNVEVLGWADRRAAQRLVAKSQKRA
jgi:inorganic pyrophosphatase